MSYCLLHLTCLITYKSLTISFLIVNLISISFFCCDNNCIIFKYVSIMHFITLIFDAQTNECLELVKVAKAI